MVDKPATHDASGNPVYFDVKPDTHIKDPETGETKAVYGDVTTSIGGADPAAQEQLKRAVNKANNRYSSDPREAELQRIIDQNQGSGKKDIARRKAAKAQLQAIYAERDAAIRAAAEKKAAEEGDASLRAERAAAQREKSKSGSGVSSAQPIDFITDRPKDYSKIQEGETAEQYRERVGGKGEYVGDSRFTGGKEGPSVGSTKQGYLNAKSGSFAGLANADKGEKADRSGGQNQVREYYLDQSTGQGIIDLSQNPETGGQVFVIPKGQPLGRIGDKIPEGIMFDTAFEQELDAKGFTSGDVLTSLRKQYGTSAALVPSVISGVEIEKQIPASASQLANDYYGNIKEKGIINYAQTQIDNLGFFGAVGNEFSRGEGFVSKKLSTSAVQFEKTFDTAFKTTMDPQASFGERIKSQAFVTLTSGLAIGESPLRLGRFLSSSAENNRETIRTLRAQYPEPNIGTQRLIGILQTEANIKQFTGDLLTFPERKPVTTAVSAGLGYAFEAAAPIALKATQTIIQKLGASELTAIGASRGIQITGAVTLGTAYGTEKVQQYQETPSDEKPTFFADLIGEVGTGYGGSRAGRKSFQELRLQQLVDETKLGYQSKVASPRVATEPDVPTGRLAPIRDEINPIPIAERKALIQEQNLGLQRSFKELKEFGDPDLLPTQEPVFGKQEGFKTTVTRDQLLFDTAIEEFLTGKASPGSPALDPAFVASGKRAGILGSTTESTYFNKPVGDRDLFFQTDFFQSLRDPSELIAARARTLGAKNVQVQAGTVTEVGGIAQFKQANIFEDALARLSGTQSSQISVGGVKMAELKTFKQLSDYPYYQGLVETPKGIKTIRLSEQLGRKIEGQTKFYRSEKDVESVVRIADFFRQKKGREPSNIQSTTYFLNDVVPGFAKQKPGYKLVYGDFYDELFSLGVTVARGEKRAVNPLLSTRQVAPESYGQFKSPLLARKPFIPLNRGADRTEDLLNKVVAEAPSQPRTVGSRGRVSKSGGRDFSAIGSVLAPSLVSAVSSGKSPSSSRSSASRSVSRSASRPSQSISRSLSRSASPSISPSIPSFSKSASRSFSRSVSSSPSYSYSRFQYPDLPGGRGGFAPFIPLRKGKRPTDSFKPSLIGINVKTYKGVSGKSTGFDVRSGQPSKKRLRR